MSDLEKSLDRLWNKLTEYIEKDDDRNDDECDELWRDVDAISKYLISRKQVDREAERKSNALCYGINLNKKLQKQINKSLWALNELVGDKGIYVSVGYEDLYFPSFEKLREWIETE